MTSRRQQPGGISSGQSPKRRPDANQPLSVAVVTRADLQSEFENYVLALTGDLASVGAVHIEGEIAKWIDPLARLLGAERCTAGEFSSAEEEPRFLLQWLVGQEPSPFASPSDSWIQRSLSNGEVVAITTLDEIPAEGASDRRTLEQTGVCSGLWVPMMAGETPVGGIGLTVLSRERSWPTQSVHRCRIAASLIGNAIHTHRKAEELQIFEDSIAKISTAFVNLRANEVDDKIQEGLGVVATALGADIVTIAKPVGDSDFETTHEWVSDAFSGHKFKGMRYGDDFPWLVRRTRKYDPIFIHTLSDWPAEAANERALCEHFGLESILGVPFKIRGEITGNLAVNSRKRRRWSEEIVPRLRLLGEVFGEALNRKEAELALQRSFKEIEALKDRLEQENIYLRQEVKLSQTRSGIIGDSDALRAALRKAEQVAATNSTVLILGETGTGKELLAHEIHRLGSRKDRPLVKVNCAALPSTLVEAELFGREKGAFTGALTRELGRFEIADGATILLDEISELSLDLQSKLLRVLQDGEFERLGSSKTHKVDVRVLAATNRDLSKAVEDKEFREDLYYRLNVFPIEVPPLRERIEDLPNLVWTFVEEFSESMGRTIERIPDSTIDALKTYHWPGNIRELRNIIERAMIMTKGPTLRVELPTDQTITREKPHKKLADVEQGYIRAIVAATGWRISGPGGAAEILGLKPTTLEARMKKLGIERPKID